MVLDENLGIRNVDLFQAYSPYVLVGDLVDFQIAKDRRDGLLHATNVSLCEESFIISKEKRDKGTRYRALSFSDRRLVCGLPFPFSCQRIF